VILFFTKTRVKNPYFCKKTNMTEITIRSEDDVLLQKLAELVKAMGLEVVDVRIQGSKNDHAFSKVLPVSWSDAPNALALADIWKNRNIGDWDKMASELRREAWGGRI
jgi:UTP:GlnB (protein PII) uridylyltransferase